MLEIKNGSFIDGDIKFNLTFSKIENGLQIVEKNNRQNAQYEIIENNRYKFTNVENDPYGVSERDFCKFKLSDFQDDAQDIVYFWVVNNQIIYIGEAKSLKDRFNSKYGNITTLSSRYTNIKMNIIANKFFDRIELYYCALDAKQGNKLNLSS